MSDAGGQTKGSPRSFPSGKSICLGGAGVKGLGRPVNTRLVQKLPWLLKDVIDPCQG